MAEVDPSRPQVVDPERSADLVRLLTVRGPLGVLNVADIVVPTVSLGDVVTPSINIRSPSFRSTDVFSAGLQAPPPINTVLADTGPLNAGIYDMIIVSAVSTTAGSGILHQHRNAANTATLMEFLGLVGPDADLIFRGTQRMVFSYEFAANERFRILNDTAGPVGSLFAFTIFARSR